MRTRYLRLSALLFVALTAFVAYLCFGNTYGLAGKRAAPRDKSVRPVLDYSQLPLQFEANQGQTDARVQFLARGGGYSIFLANDEAVLVLRKPRPDDGNDAAADNARPPKMAARPEARPAEVAVARMRLVGAQVPAAAQPLEELPGKTNYFLGNDETKWRANVPNYAKVRYNQVYEGIDLVYYGNQRQLEYDFIVAPHADPRQIRLNLSGVESVGTDGDGNLVLKDGALEFSFKKPVVYQTVNGERREVAGRYALLGEEEKERKGGGETKEQSAIVSFALGEYDRSQPLVIDPVVAYSTLLGGFGQDVGRGVAVDAANNAYIIGQTFAVNFPTANPLQGNTGGQTDVFVTKINAAGNALLYSAYLGGGNDDGGWAIAVDASGNAYLAGRTFSPNFPTVNPLQATKGGSRDIFAAKLNSLGSALLYSTFLGGNAQDFVNQGGLAIDAAGNAYIAGTTYSRDYPTLNPFQTTSLRQPFYASLDGGACGVPRARRAA